MILQKENVNMAEQLKPTIEIHPLKKIFETELEGLVRERFSNVLMEIEPENGVEILELMTDFERDFENKFNMKFIIMKILGFFHL